MLEQMIDLFFFVLFIVCFFFPYIYLGIRVDAAFKKKCLVAREETDR